MTGRKDAVEAWNALNKRQQVYLEHIYYADQDAEHEARSGDWMRMRPGPAAEWRWVPYSQENSVEDTPIQRGLRSRGELDVGAGRTLGALERRDLIEIKDEPFATPFGVRNLVMVKLTTLGRATARAGLGHVAPKKKPAGMLPDWAWETLGRLYAAGDQGLGWNLPWNKGVSNKAHDVLIGRPDGPYLAGDRYGRRTITARGIHHFEVHHACYSALYPEAKVPEPRPNPYAHDGLAGHRRPLPADLLDAPTFRLLAHLVMLHATGNDAQRRSIVAEYVRHDLPVPDEVASLPPCLRRADIGRAQGKPTAGSIDTLLGHPDGPLVQAFDVLVYPRHDIRSEMFAVTDAGLAHYAANLERYRRHLPDVPAYDPST
ncbi:hypothetical protein [Saccharothrix hoggarensis]|uniref:Uncharacterized protein n=1 Tax=Saccharothrix hoggarensis TaxID=913853 RepID=A0ABW3QGS0_9PSEU